MAADGVLGSGVRVGYSASSPVSWTSITQILDCDFPGIETDEVETTVHNATSPTYRRHMAGLRDVKEMVLTLLADLDPATNATHQALFTMMKAGTTVWWRIEVPVNRAKTSFMAFEFQAFVKNWMPSTPQEDRQELEVTIRFDGTDFGKYGVVGAGSLS